MLEIARLRRYAEIYFIVRSLSFLPVTGFCISSHLLHSGTWPLTAKHVGLHPLDSKKKTKKGNLEPFLIKRQKQNDNRGGMH